MLIVYLHQHIPQRMRVISEVPSMPSPVQGVRKDESNGTDLFSTVLGHHPRTALWIAKLSCGVSA